jgi:hypothetical protein
VKHSYRAQKHSNTAICICGYTVDVVDFLFCVVNLAVVQ